MQNFPSAVFFKRRDFAGYTEILLKISIKIPNGHAKEQYALPNANAARENAINAQPAASPAPDRAFKRDGAYISDVGFAAQYVFPRLWYTSRNCALIRQNNNSATTTLAAFRNLNVFIKILRVKRKTSGDGGAKFFYIRAGEFCYATEILFMLSLERSVVPTPSSSASAMYLISSSA